MECRAAPEPKQPISLTTERQTECNEFPDPGYGGADPPLYKFYPEETKITAVCWTLSRINQKDKLYMRTTAGCYIDEEFLQAGSKDLQSLLPECTKPKPYLVKTTKNEYLLPKNGFLMNCYETPSLASPGKREVQWGARHVWCSVQGEKVGSSSVWWRDAHVPVVDFTGVGLATWMPENRTQVERAHCYFPDDVFDGTVLGVGGGAGVCVEGVVR
ncbi:hypothetical protein FKW77_003633 [Venturia effusa]|uniref:Uncharacterized protein n=1 Tax=Venturia effusa TaxID=50376 RepID=A0A517LPV7_9PEZI|nr:hypothetical protein FKW77_003633 [Venturia effusa]